MSHKLLDLYPKILSQSEKNLDLSKFTALALPVIPGDKVELVKSRFLKEITEFTKH
jgi:leucyl aminopeptidase